MVHVRWMIRSDINHVLDIEHANFGSDAWTKREITEFARSPRGVVLVAEEDCEVVGYICYKLEKGFLVIENIAVAYQREGIGTALVEHLKRKLEFLKRTRIVTTVSERNVKAQLFFKSCGFICNRISRDFFLMPDGAKADAYAFDFLNLAAVEVANGAD